MSDKKQSLNQLSLTPFIQASKVTQTLFSNILSNQKQLMVSSFSQVIDQTDELLNTIELQSIFKIQNNLINQQREQFLEFSQHLATSFQTAQADYQKLFTTEVKASTVNSATTASTAESATAKATATTGTAKATAKKAKMAKAAAKKAKTAKAAAKKANTAKAAPAATNTAANPAPAATNTAANPAPVATNTAANPAPVATNTAANPAPVMAGAAQLNEEKPINK